MSSGVAICFCRHGYPYYKKGEISITTKAAIECYMNGIALMPNGHTQIFTSETLRAEVTSKYYAKALNAPIERDIFLTDKSMWLKSSPLEKEYLLDRYYQKIIAQAKAKNISQIVLITHQPQLDFMLKEIRVATSESYVVKALSWDEMERNLQTRIFDVQRLELNKKQQTKLEELLKENCMIEEIENIKF